ncbi:hypothetical protein H312_00583, partial [Anncaliia algerae PRA339]
MPRWPQRNINKDSVIDISSRKDRKSN